MAEWDDGESAVRETVMRGHLGLIVDACRAACPNLQAIILYGGFGRDEGSWFQDEDGRWRPYNDYDLRIVSRERVPDEVLKTLARTLAREIGIRWIDLGWFHPDDLKRLRPSILNYDFKYASQVIHGDSGVLNKIPEFDGSMLPMEEARTLFFTRLYPFVGSLGEEGLNTALEGEESRFFRNQMAKAVLAAVDVLLLFKGAYDASYRTRVERLAALYPTEDEFVALSRWALSEKLRPQASPMSPGEVRELYARVHRHFFSVMYRGLSAWHRREVMTPEDIEVAMKWRPAAVMKRLYWFMKFRNFHMERQMAVMLAQAYIAAAWIPDGVNENWLKRGLTLLRRADARLPRRMTWDAARREAARLRMEV